MLVLIIITLFIILLCMPIKVQIIKNSSESNINLTFIKFFNIKIELENIINKYYKNNTNTSLTNILNTIKTMKIYKSFIKQLFSTISINKATLVYNSNNIYTSVIYWNSIYTLRNFINRNFLNINNEYYNVLYSENNKNKGKFEILFNIRVINFIFAYIISVKDIIKNKRKGSVVNVRTSNK